MLGHSSEGWTSALIVGGNGTLGREMISYLNSLGYTTIATTRHPTELTNAHYTISEKDLSEHSCHSLKKQVDELVSEHNLRISFVFLVAGFGRHDDQCDAEVLQEMHRVNTEMPAWWCNHGPKDAIYVLFSSGAVYGTDGTVPLTHYSRPNGMLNIFVGLPVSLWSLYGLPRSKLVFLTGHT